MNNDLRSGFPDYFRENEPPFLMSPEPSMTRGRTRTTRRRAATLAVAATLVAVIAATALTLRPGGTGTQAVDPAGNPRPTATGTSEPMGLPSGVIPTDERPPLPELAGTDLSGAPLTTDYTGHLTVIIIWWSGCAPCASQMPDLIATQDTSPEGTQFIGLNVRDTPRTAQAFQTQWATPWPSFDDTNGQLLAEIDAVLPVRGLPTTILVDQHGRLAGQQIGAVNPTNLVGLLNALNNTAPAPAEPPTSAQPDKTTTCGPGSLPLMKLSDVAAAQRPAAPTAPTSPTVEAALRNLVPDIDLSQAVYEPMGPAPLDPVWVRYGNDTYLVQADKPAKWFAVPATRRDCSNPDSP